MRISFDIDDTIRMHGEGYECDPNRVPFFLRAIFRERLRKGSHGLFKSLQDAGHEICIYTTSNRSRSYIKWWLWFYGVNLKLIVNAELHARVVRSTRMHRAPSKNPAKFAIDLHVDDLPGVREEGETHGFRTLIINPEDKDWVAKVLTELA